MRFIFISGRTSKQGQQINIGKDKPEYSEIVSTLQMNSEDLEQLGLTPGNQVDVRTLWGNATFQCIIGDLPRGMVFAPYGPPTSKILSANTSGTGMPIQKGMEVEIEPIEVQPPDGKPGGTQEGAQ
jgi:formylmethanofuran dehydrogenase subunit D